MFISWMCVVVGVYSSLSRVLLIMLVLSSMMVMLDVFIVVGV